MKKIIIAFTGKHFSESAFEFVKKINEQEPILVTGVFLPMYDFSRIWIFTEPLYGQSFLPDLEIEEEELMQDNINRFTAACKVNKIAYKIHGNNNQMSISSLVKESRFADLLIISSEKFYEYMGTDASNPSLREALHYSECPVLLLPEIFEFPENVILAYDGSSASVYAIKQYAYLFPEFSTKETILVYSNQEVNAEIPYEGEMKEWSQQHFKNLKLMKLHDDSKIFFSNWVTRNNKTIVVSGSFGRNITSQFFRSSFVSEVVSKHQLPVLITHK